MKSCLSAIAVFCALMLPLGSQADTKMDVLLQQGISEYETGNYPAAIDHWVAAMVYGNNSGQNTMYAASYLCACWYFGHGFTQDEERAEAACQLAKGNRQKFEMELFQQAMADNAGATSTYEFVKARQDAAEALKWFLRRTPE